MRNMQTQCKNAMPCSRRYCIPSGKSAPRGNSARKPELAAAPYSQLKPKENRRSLVHSPRDIVGTTISVIGDSVEERLRHVEVGLGAANAAVPNGGFV
jgi:hypothetical protein